MNRQMRLAVVGLVVPAGGGLAYAKAGKSKPPVAQAMNPMAMLGNAFGGGGRNTFGNTKTGNSGS